MNSEFICQIVADFVAVVFRAEEPSARPNAFAPLPRRPKDLELPHCPIRPVSSFEETPRPNTPRILKPGFLAGPHFRVHDKVTIYSERNHYVIGSDYLSL
ncbi:MAG: hypothetical protein QOH31_7226 [Verrucomicrobiota bacterium]|jgi:hypothetical protein